jgi:hypothetical protein
MTVEQVNKVFELYDPKTMVLEVMYDVLGGQCLTTKQAYIKFDNDNRMCFIVTANRNLESMPKKRTDFLCIDYDHIHAVNLYPDVDAYPDLLKKIGFEDDDIEKIKASVSDLSNPKTFL